MPILTENEIRAFSSNRVTLNESRTYQSREGKLFSAKEQKHTTVFLSHSHGDKEIVADTVNLISKVGVDVYVDWQDDAMPVTTSGVTAAGLKKQIKACDKFVLLASPDAIRSNWVNWELGYGDSVKYIEHIALFPFLKGSGTANWKDAEYLQIYPYIEKEEEMQLVNYSYQMVATFYVRYPDGRKVALKNWLKA